MSEDIALNESEQSETIAFIAPIRRKPLHISVARLVSTLLSPAVVSVPFILLVALYHTSNSTLALGDALLAFFFLSLGPMTYVLLGVRRGEFTDVDVSLRSQRIRPFLFGLGSALLGFIALSLLHAPKNLQTVLITTLISGLLMLLITLRWKISIHASSVASALTMLTVLYGTILLPTFVLLIAVCWSRVVLRRHTLGQVVAGSILSIAITVVALMIRGV